MDSLIPVVLTGPPLDSTQLGPTPPGPPRQQFNDLSPSKPQPWALIAPWAPFSGQHGAIPDGGSMAGTGQDARSLYNPNMADLTPAAWDGSDCLCEDPA